MTILFAYPDNEALSEKLVERGNGEAGRFLMRDFPDGETYFRCESDVRGREVALVCSLDRPDPKIAPLALACATFRRLGAIKVGLIAPYLAYLRQDREFHAGEAISAPIIAGLLSSMVDWIATVDPHLHRISNLDQIFSVPALVASAGESLGEWIGTNVENPFIIGPDAESEQWVISVARAAGAPSKVLRKEREGDRRVRITVPDFSIWGDRTPVLIDDVVSTGQTLLEVVKQLPERGMSRPAVCTVVHGVFSGDACERLEASGLTVVTTNTIAHRTNRVDVTDCLLEKLRLDRTRS